MSNKPYAVYIGIGSNVDKETNVPKSINLLKDSPLLSVVSISPVYETAPVFKTDQDMFFNLVCKCQTTLEPLALKWQVLRPIEELLGRSRENGIKHAPRPIDLDILLFDDRVCRVDDSCVPDPDIMRCAHIVIPLADVAQDLIHPITQKSIATHASSYLNAKGVTKQETINGT
ncbi:2-amino-4-hydroxy-6-hydroxymethyldihydropteridine diphosphokinase [bacterium]|mgnify:CR=1 FL=1|jgi:2-amino-4-hydroxy-6-hydroxymethyldihydropteridine diphosphokinase|nr:2-amino-4-hydroxy-6-hydroxymethyldihydropteridine diphosphokinase [bacterium]